MKTSSPIRLVVSACLFSELVVVVAVQSSASPAATAKEPAPGLQVVLEAFKSRQEVVRSLRFQWEESVTKGDAPFAGDTVGGNSEQNALVALEKRMVETLLLPKRVLLIADGKRVRFEEEGPQVGRRPNTRVPTKRIAVFDGESGTEYLPHSELNYPLAEIAGHDSTKAFEYVGSKPIVLTYRGLDWIQTYLRNVRDGTAKLESGVISDQPCLILTITLLGHGDLQESIWIDPAQNCSVLRRVSRSGGKIRSTTDVSYKVDEQHGNVPIAWTSSYWDQSDKLMRTVQIQVIDYTINSSIPDSTFQLVFAPGTLVRDSRPGKQHYILREDATKRIVTDDELRSGATYEQLINSEPAGLPARGGGLLFVTVGVVVVLAAVVAFRYYRRVAQN